MLTIVVVDVLLRRIVVDEKVVVDLAPLHDHAGLAGADSGEVRLPVPAVERTYPHRQGDQLPR